MEALILRFDAPLMSFGGVMVDQHNVTDRFPGLSLFAGLFANALGWHHRDGERIGRLQERLIVASRWDLAGEAIRDYHTVDLGQEKMRHPGWTTRGLPEHREGGPDARYGTHQRYRHYWANGLLTTALALAEADVAPDLDALEAALRHPARPLFIGRKACLPAGPILAGRRSGDGLLAILQAEPRATCRVRNASGAMAARWPAELGRASEEQTHPVYDQRDWHNQWHAGSRLVAEGPLPEVPPCT
ncbi:type I-E CRISPR-associated protein Cas5/CasD [Parasulfuritortus cantonensis]|uniref:Type I-E CRISPR-associated protein Cas5/CasD n=1 Tax=Parasulfuritortus cantonensis TaxID=2528202 RepID=A0A4V6NB47_9PROT|nr:type I-E CRISPR-associated protein Cas5/CasD [Parasulfuritortus cantonensis]TCJ19792.1 type I-E CRISPR-associated protein Cas5/CasD [Parasulfuritortus cantonensis]